MNQSLKLTDLREMYSEGKVSQRYCPKLVKTIYLFLYPLNPLTNIYCTCFAMVRSNISNITILSGSITAKNRAQEVLGYQGSVVLWCAW